LPLFVTPLVALADEREPAHPLTRWLGARPMVDLGRASYATYILHVPLFVPVARSILAAQAVARTSWPTWLRSSCCPCERIGS
jgi:peptidoglycan/LPS O-acetylase OafA/YrhL